MKILMKHWKGFCVGFVYMNMALLPAYADDTEIYFGGNSIATDTETQPNVMFILDTSGSMAWDVTRNSGTNNQRLNALKSAMNGVLGSVNNVNVGIMRYTNPGGPVLHKIEDIAAIVDDGLVTVSSSVSASQNDAVEAVTGGAVTLNDATLEIADRITGLTTASAAVSDPVNDIAEESRGNSALRYLGEIIKTSGTPRTSTDLELMVDTDSGSIGQHIGLRFSSLNIPLTAKVESAKLDFIVKAIASQKAEDELSVDISGTLDNAAFSAANFDVSSRVTVDSIVPWSVVATPAVNDTLATNDLSSVVQDLVAGRASSTAPFVFVMTESADSVGGRRELEKDSGGSKRPTLTVKYGTATQNQTLGLRFSGVDIPSDATITNAYIEFTAARSNDETANYTISAQNNGNAPEFTAVANNIRSRAKLGTQVAWNGVEPWVANRTYQTPNIKTIVQDLVNHADWCGGNAMAFMVDGSTTNRRVPFSYDGNSGLAPKLVIEYDTTSIPATGGCSNKQVSYQINGGANDAEQKGTSGSSRAAQTSSNTLDLDSSNLYVGLRFNGINIPKLATVTSAYLELTSSTTETGALSIALKSQQSDSAEVFENNNNNNITSDRTWSGTPVSWALSSWVANGVYSSPDIKSLVQTVINRSGWQAGNSMAFQLSYASGAGKRAVIAYDQTAIKSPRLVINYQVQETATTTRTVRDDLIRIVNDEIIASGSTPIVETLHEAALYFKGDNVKYGKERSDSTAYDNNTRVSVSDSWSGGTLVRAAGCTDSNLNSEACKTEYISGTPKYITPMIDSCQENHLVLVTDGDPTDGNQSISDIEALIGKSCANVGSTDRKCGEELAEYLYQNDLFTGVGELSGKQNVTVHTIALVDGGSTWLSSIAAKGGGSNYMVTGADSAAVVDGLTEAFNSILGGVLDVDTSFVAPAVAINQFNRLTHREEIYYAVFRPQSTPKWPGNLKKYGLSGSNVTIVDANGVPAVDPDSGAFFDSTKSLWSAAVDGNDVTKGGMASQLPDPADRKLYIHHSTSSSSALTASDNLLTNDNVELTKTLLGIAAESDAYRTKLINWIRGVDEKDENADGSTTDFRYAIGDPLHSRPLVVTYDSDPNDDGDPSDAEYYLFFGTNEGLLHVVDGGTGEEKFAIAPEELLKNFNIFYKNQEGVTRPYGLDGESTVWVKDVDADGKIETADGDHVYLYIGMRRGGRNYYAYDLSDLNAPELMWEIKGGTGDFAELGQSWSKPLLTKIKYKDGGSVVTKQVLAFSAGYDTNQDDAAVRTADGQGRGIYIVDAETGDFLWGAGEGLTETHADMDYSIPARLAGADVNGDGILDMLFFGDAGGQVFRVDFDSSGTQTLAQFGELQKIAQVSVAADAENTRRFYHGADIALVRQGSERFLSVMIGSGWRAHPLDQVVVDRFYSIKQPITKPNSTDGTLGYLGLTEANFYDATENFIQDGTAQQQLDAAAALAASKGWYVTLENTGEKVLSRPLVIEGKVVFTTYEPTSTLIGCTPVAGQSREYILSVLDASAVINRDNTGALTKSDRSTDLNLQGIVDDTVIVVTEDGTGAFQGTQDSGLEFEGDRAIRTFWYQE